MTRLRLVYFGTPAFAVPTLEALLSSRHEVAGVVTQPDRPRGRGQRVSFSPVKTLAVERGLPVLQPERLRDEAFLSELAALRADCGVVAAYGRILPEPVLAMPRFGLLNVHASLLPRYRGAAPIQRAVIAGERVTGVTIMRVVKALDAGPMLASVSRPIEPDETSPELEADLATLGAGLMVDVLDRLEQVGEEPQDESAATYAPRIVREDGLIDWRASSRAIHDRVRALHPWPHAFTFLAGERIIVHRTAVEAEGARPQGPGTVVEAAGDRLTVATGDGRVRLLTVQAEGRRPMAPREFLAGHPISPGTAFDPAPPAAS